MARKKKRATSVECRAATKKAVRRAAVIMGSYEKLAAATENISKWRAIRMHQYGQVDPAEAIEIEKATRGMVNRLEFFPDLIFGNKEAVAVVRRMLTSP